MQKELNLKSIGLRRIWSHNLKLCNSVLKTQYYRTITNGVLCSVGETIKSDIRGNVSDSSYIPTHYYTLFHKLLYQRHQMYIIRLFYYYWYHIQGYYRNLYLYPATLVITNLSLHYGPFSYFPRSSQQIIFISFL